jgi:hypothetical protein
VVMPKLVTWMNNQRVGELTKLANGAHTFKYAPEWLANLVIYNGDGLNLRKPVIGGVG